MSYQSQLTGNNRRMFFCGISLFAAIFISLAYLFVFQKVDFFKVISIMIASLAGGRSAAILTGLELKLHNLVISLIVFAINLAWLLTFFALLIAFFHHVTEIKYVGKFLESTKERAELQKLKVATWGSWALPVFIWLPFPFTGSFAGAIIGFLMGIPLARLLVIVIGSMLVGIISWTYGFHSLLIITGPVGKIVTYSLIGILVIHGLVQNKKQLKSINKN